MENSINTLGGALWVNLLNTKRITQGHAIDILEDNELFLYWLKENDVLQMAGEDDAHQMAQLKRLRGYLQDVIKRYSEGISLEAIDGLKEINNVLALTPATLSASYKNNETTLEFHACDNRNELTLQTIHSFLDSSTKYGLERVRQCAHEECILYFLDISKSGKRKWCSMETCGNRKKAAKHYHKTKASK